MNDYQPPVEDMLFLLTRVLDFKHEDLDSEMLDSIFGEAAKLASDILAPLNSTGDQEGATLKEGNVATAQGFKEAYAAYREGGWNAVPFDPAYGGQGLPYAVAFPVQEMWQGANTSFSLCPLLNQGAVEAIFHHASQDLKDIYLEKLISGQWTGTMNLTEPQAGSDLGLLKAKAEPDGSGAYKIFGQKIFITYGEHDLAENIIHLVLARLPDAPEDVRGISLFIVPKFLTDGRRNDVICTGLEHKLGIHASPTCTMQFGENGGATGYLIGEPHQGLKYMFTMMNNARLSVGLQGVAIAERAYQQALAYASERLQGKSLKSGRRVAIAEHPDVKRMLLSMRSQLQAGRALTYEAALAMDNKDQARVDLLTPVVKSWCTDMAVSVASEGVQIHGGAGFIEESGAAQYYRDARILPIYEGTNGIQAADLVFRKILRDGGTAAKAYIDIMRARAPAYGEDLAALEEATNGLLKMAGKDDPEAVAFIAKPYLNAFGILAGGALLSKSAAAAKDHENRDFALEKQETAAFYRRFIRPFARAHLAALNG